MPKYTFFYRGGKPRNAKEGAERQPAWDAWFRSIQGHLVDRGAAARSLGGVTAGGELRGIEPTKGYSVIDAASEKEAIDIARSCPTYNEGGVVEIARYVEPPSEGIVQPRVPKGS